MDSGLPGLFNRNVFALLARLRKFCWVKAERGKCLAWGSHVKET